MAKGKQDKNKPSLFWFASTSDAKGREHTLGVLRKASGNLAHEINIFEVPTDIKFRSFDDLIRLLDDIVKQENSLEGILRRTQRQALELTPDVEFKVTWMRQSMSVEEYVRRFQWDEARYPKMRNARDLLENIVNQVSRLDEDMKQKLLHYNEVKNTSQSLESRKDASLQQRDLTDVFGSCADKDFKFIDTDNLITVPVIVSKAQHNAFLNNYSDPNICPGVVPQSAHCHDKATDSNGNQLFTVLIMKRNKDQFFTSMRKLKCHAKDYQIVEGAFSDRKKKRAEITAEKERQEKFLGRICVASFSDIMMAIIHLKALKIFVDSVLRLGVPAKFAAYSVLPVPGTKQNTKLWDEMTKILAVDDIQSKDESYNSFAFAEYNHTGAN